MAGARWAAAAVAAGTAAAVWASQATLTREELLSGARPQPTPFAVPSTPATDALPTVRSGRLEAVRRGERSVPWTLIRLWDGGRRLALQHSDTCDEGARVHVEESDRAVVVQVVAGRGSAGRGWRACSDGARTLVVLDRPLGGRALLQAATSGQRPDGQAGRSLAELFEDAPPWPGDPWWSGGREVPREELSLAAGPEHCAWQEAVYLGGDALPAPRDERGALWARDPDGVLDHAPQVQRGFQARAVLPPEARDTGYAQGDVQLWTVPGDPEHVYLVHSERPGDVERWVRGGGGCA